MAAENIHTILLVIVTGLQLAFVLGRWIRGAEKDGAIVARDLVAAKEVAERDTAAVKSYVDAKVDDMARRVEVSRVDADGWTKEFRARLHDINNRITTLPEHMRADFVVREAQEARDGECSADRKRVREELDAAWREMRELRVRVDNLSDMVSRKTGGRS